MFTNFGENKKQNYLSVLHKFFNSQNVHKNKKLKNKKKIAFVKRKIKDTFLYTSIAINK